MGNERKPSWWNSTYDSSWDRVKAAFKRDWDQTRHDLGGRAPDTNQEIKNTVAQAAGKEPIPPRGAPAEDREAAYRLGYGARQHYGGTKARWDDRIEADLARDWEGLDPDRRREWREYRDDVRRGWDYSDTGKPT